MGPNLKKDGPTLFDGVDFGLNMDSRVALVGANGTGKSTLLKLMYEIMHISASPTLPIFISVSTFYVALVGANGMGKGTLLKLMYETLHLSASPSLPIIISPS